MGKKNNVGLKIFAGVMAVAFAGSITYSAVPAFKDWTDGIIDKIVVRPSEDVSSEEPSSEAPSEDLSEEPVIPSIQYEIIEELDFSDFVEGAVLTTASTAGVTYNVYTYQSELAPMKIIVNTISDLSTDNFISDNNGMLTNNIRCEYVATSDVSTQKLTVGIIVHEVEMDYYGFTFTRYSGGSSSIGYVSKGNSNNFVVSSFTLIQII